MKTYSYLIYQINDIGNTSYAFRSWDEAKGLIKMSEYNCVFNSEIKVEDERTKTDVLLMLYEKFNINHPKNYKGHSLSVSDIVVLIDEKTTYWYYCDSFGWVDIKEYLKETGRNHL